MFNKHGIMAMTAAAFLAAGSLTACGGGGGDSPGSGSNTPPPITGGGTEVPPEPRLQGNLSVVANQVTFIKGDRYEFYYATTIDQFESAQGIYDTAPNPDEVGNTPPGASPSAPMAAFGIRVGRFMQGPSGILPGEQNVVGRIAFDFTERGDSPGIASGQVGEIMRILIDKVEFGTDVNGQLTTLRLQPDAKVHVYGRTAAGIEVRETINTAPIDSIRLVEMMYVIDHDGDNSSVVLTTDFDKLLSQAGAQLAALNTIAGHFSMKLSMTPVAIVRPAGAASGPNPAVERKDLVGEAITVNDQPAVSGAGLSGNVWIRQYP